MASHEGHEGHHPPEHGGGGTGDDTDSGGGHHGGGIGGGHSMGGMVLNWSNNVVIVFDWWRSDSPEGLFVSCWAILLAAFLFEAFRAFRTKQDKRLVKLLETQPSALGASATGPSRHRYGLTGGMEDEEREGLLGGDGGVRVPESVLRVGDGGMSEREGVGLRSLEGAQLGQQRMALACIRGRSTIQLYRTFLHATELLLGYFLMMAFMTLNGYICTSLILGAALGFFFCQSQPVPANRQACH
ncbi:Ctr copper transporter family-domain-containing protein [Fimicolochytrium jonesii]|uniref:Ctr copper transporter family-domain-containing protein n=1 Tax=Fimicolochytrium jonesii TaxID=1396493 RepID=UPI0022FDCD9C|nr:Ctr copper transporter family-domain-containing protein [Fimicolochytrium jonesii]KAI8817337.1 Ctr copper transporter family-domain-containing protein [Fimicolochytrium jonesii]